MILPVQGEDVTHKPMREGVEGGSREGRQKALEEKDYARTRRIPYRRNDGGVELFDAKGMTG